MKLYELLNAMNGDQEVKIVYSENSLILTYFGQVKDVIRTVSDSVITSEIKLTDERDSRVIKIYTKEVMKHEII